MDDLIARLEAAAEGSRELDIEIATLRYGEPLECFGRSDKHPGFFMFNTGGTQLEEAAHYTTSLDAALTLVPEDARLKLTHVFNDTQTRLIWRADIFTGLAETYREFTGQDTESAPALALCIAALKARHHA